MRAGRGSPGRGGDLHGGADQPPVLRTVPAAESSYRGGHGPRGPRRGGDLGHVGRACGDPGAGRGHVAAAGDGVAAVPPRHPAGRAGLPGRVPVPGPKRRERVGISRAGRGCDSGAAGGRAAGGRRQRPVAGGADEHAASGGGPRGSAAGAAGAGDSHHGGRAGGVPARRRCAVGRGRAATVVRCGFARGGG